MVWCSYPGREALMAGGKRQRSDWMIADSGCVQVEESTRQFTGVIPEGRGASRQQAGRQAGGR